MIYLMILYDSILFLLRCIILCLIFTKNILYDVMLYYIMLFMKLYIILCYVMLYCIII